MPVTLPPSLVQISYGETSQPKRPTLQVTDVGQVFALANRTRCQRQYASNYFCRLGFLESVLKDRVRRCWSDLGICRLNDLMAMEHGDNSATVLIGVLHKQMKLKPSVLEFYTKTLDVHFPQTNFLSEDDFAYLEERDGRVELVWPDQGNTPLKTLTTGMVIAVQGVLSSSGQFNVQDYMLPGSDLIETRITRWPSYQPSNEGNPLLAVVSNLRMAETVGAGFQRLLKFHEWLANDPMANRVARLVVAGNAVGKLPSEDNSIGKSGGGQQLQNVNVDSNALCAMEEIDTFLDQLAAVLPVDIVAGSEDPTTFSLPQLPLPPRLFPTSRQRASFQSLPNPCLLDVQHGEQMDDPKRRMMVVAGQAVDDLARYTAFNEPIDCLVQAIRSHLIAPTSPDTLSCLPFDTNDLLCLPTPCVGPKGHELGIDDTKERLQVSQSLHSWDECTSLFPDIILSGGHTKTSASVLSRDPNSLSQADVLAVCVSDFRTTGDVVLIDPAANQVVAVISIG